MDPGMRGTLFRMQDRPNNIYKLPNNILSVVCGPSMSGKTSYVLNLILNTVDPRTRQITEYSTLNPDIIYIFAPTLDQPLYQQLFKLKDQVPNICADIDTADTVDKLPNPEELDPEYERKCIIIDDAIVLKNQDKLINYFTKGRHYG
jgi:GTPase SAR1 family protein